MNSEKIWKLVTTAVTLKDVNEKLALDLIIDAAKEAGCCDDKKCCGGSCEGVTEEKPVVPTTASVLYGEGGKYTDANDPRDENARGHKLDGGKIESVNVLVRTKPGAKYKAVLVETLPLDESCTIYVSVQNKNGSLASVSNVRQTTGSVDGHGYDDLYAAGNSKGEFFMGSDGKFYGQNIGPYGVVVTDGQDNIISDFVYGLGLYNGQHVSYRVGFREV